MSIFAPSYHDLKNLCGYYTMDAENMAATETPKINEI